jgi:hypothetical protein
MRDASSRGRTVEEYRIGTIYQEPIHGALSDGGQHKISVRIFLATTTHVFKITTYSWLKSTPEAYLATTRILIGNTRVSIFRASDRVISRREFEYCRRQDRISSGLEIGGIRETKIRTYRVADVRLYGIGAVRETALLKSPSVTRPQRYVSI